MKYKDEDKEWQLMAKYLSEEVNYFEKSRFEEKLKHDKGGENLYLEAKKIWDETGYALQYNKIDNDKAYAEVIKTIDANKKNSHSKRRNITIISLISTIAAVLVILFVVINPLSTNSELISFFTENSNQELILDDGSHVELNKYSSIQYPQQFKGENRMVNFKGEGFFNIARNEEKPFVVKVGPVAVRVLGTTFNIKAQPLSEFIEVVVENGKVEVAVGSDKVVLTKGFKVVYNKARKSFEKSRNRNVNYLSWKTNEIQFKDSKFNDVILTLESVYGINIKLSDTTILNNRLTANFNHTDLKSVMSVICKTFNLTVEEKGTEYYISTQ